jgi:hypothetical protein
LQQYHFEEFLEKVMKKRFEISFSIILSLCLLFALVGTASAKSVVNSEVNPTVTPITGITNFTVTLLPILDLPGQTTTTNGLVVPSGFPAGEKQFEGKGVEINGLTYGTAKVCFPITAISQGWGGQVGSWDGTKWNLLDTTLTTPDESAYSLACATISSNGTYALLAWVVDASKLPSSKPDCDFKIYSFGFLEPDDWHKIYEGTVKTVIIGSMTDLTGMHLTFSLLKAIPANAFIMNGSLQGTIVYEGGSFYSLYDSHGAYITADNSIESESAMFRFDFGSCKIDMPLGAG